MHPFKNTVMLKYSLQKRLVMSILETILPHYHIVNYCIFKIFKMNNHLDIQRHTLVFSIIVLRNIGKCFINYAGCVIFPSLFNSFTKLLNEITFSYCCNFYVFI